MDDDVFDLIMQGNISALEDVGFIHTIYEVDIERNLNVVISCGTVSVINWMLSYNLPAEVLNERGDNGFTLLTDVLGRQDKNNIVPIIWALLKAGCDIDSIGAHSMTALHLALRICDDAVVTALCRLGARMDICDDLGEEGTQIELAKKLGRFHLLEPWIKN